MCSEINDDLNNLIFHCSPDFNIPKGQEHRNIIVIPNEDDCGENVPESKLGKKLPVVYDDMSKSDKTFEQRHLAARAYALGHHDLNHNTTIHALKSHCHFKFM